MSAGSVIRRTVASFGLVMALKTVDMTQRPKIRRIAW
jgi:hypothetical protein